MSSHATVRTLRALLSAAAFLVLLAPAAAHAQGRRITFSEVPWGLPADSVRVRIEALGWPFTHTADHGDLVFQRPPGVVRAIFAKGRLVQVILAQNVSAADREDRLRFLTDSITAVYGAPSLSNANGAAWGGTLTSLAAISPLPREGESPYVTLVYLGGAAAERENERRVGTADPFPALAEGWVETVRSRSRRMSADTTSIAARGEIYRVRVRFDLLEQQMDGRQPYDAMVYDGHYDCTGRRMRAMNLRLLLQGRPVKTLGNGGWMDVPADTGQAEDLNSSCALAAEYLLAPAPRE